MTVGAGIKREGGTCGYNTLGVGLEADPPISVLVPACTLEARRTSSTTWAGACTFGSVGLGTVAASFEALTLP